MIVIFLLHYSVTVASMLTVGRLEISYINIRFQQTGNVILGKLTFPSGQASLESSWTKSTLSDYRLE